MILPGGWPDVAGWLAGEGQPGPPSWGVVKAGAARLGQCINAVTVQRHRCGSWTARRGGCRVRFPRWPAACGPRYRLPGPPARPGPHRRGECGGSS